MKDFNLIKHIAKLSGAKPESKNKDSLYTYFSYGNKSNGALITAYIMFEKGLSKFVYFDLSDVYNVFGKSKYSSYSSFLDRFTSQYGYFGKDNVDSDLYATINVRDYRVDDAISPALSSVTVMFNCLNEMLGYNFEGFSEKEWKDCYSLYLDSQRKTSKIALIVSGVAAVGGLVMALFATGAIGNGNSGGLAALGFLLMVGGIVGAIVSFLRFKVYKGKLEKSLRNNK